MMDMQDWYVANKMSNANFPADRVVDSSYADYAVKKLGPFVLENKASTLPAAVANGFRSRSGEDESRTVIR